MTISRNILEQLVADDEFGLLKVAAKAPAATADDRLLSSFNEILDFTRASGHAPRDPDAHDVDPIEAKLYWRLEGIRASSEKSEKLRGYDDMDLLAGTEAPASIADILEAPDTAAILEQEAAEIFTLRNVPESIDQPDEVAQQKPCEDFDSYRQLLEECHRQIRSGERKLIAFQGEGSIAPGQFYVLRGIRTTRSAVSMCSSPSAMTRS